MNFKYGKKEIEYLKSRDRRLGEVIDQIGRIRWTVEPDLFSAIVQNIVSQQISGSAAASILARIEGALGEIAPESVAKTDVQAFRDCGVSLRKTEYIKEFADKVVSGELDLSAVAKCQTRKSSPRSRHCAASACGRRRCFFFSPCSARTY